VTDWAAIEGSFWRLRGFVLNDLERYVAQEVGGNFAVVGLMLAACDALANLRYGSRSSGHDILARCLPDGWKPAASVLYDAVRNGLLHGYEPKVVMGDGAGVGFAIGWHGSVGHMEFTTEARDVLYVSAPSLVRSLRDTFDDVERELRESAELRDNFYTRDRKDRELHLSGHRAEVWREVVAGGRVAPSPPSGATGPPGWAQPS
jgi:hypothetical protein